MKRMSIDMAAFAPAFGIDMADAGSLGRTAPQVGWGRVAPLGETVFHRHDESESFIILSGSGTVETDKDTVAVGAGDILAFEPFERHVLRNTGDTDLLFADLYWRDSAAAVTTAGHEDAVAPLSGTGRPVFVFSTPPTPNGDLHIGHLSGPYLGADVYTRFQRLNGTEAYHLTGSDDFQSYVVGRARAEGKTPEAVAAYYAAEIQSTLAMMDIHLDQFTITMDSPGYVAGAQDFFARAIRDPRITFQATPALCDGASGAYLYEVDTFGVCPGCGSGCGGNICEECGEPNTCADIMAPKSRLSETRPHQKDVARWTIDLGASAADIRAHQMASRMPARILALTDRVLAKGQKIAVSHPADWGIRPAEGTEGAIDQVIWVWPEMAYGFLYGIEALGQRQGRAWDKAAPSDDWKIVHFFGYDNSFYHAILYPALYAASNPGWTPDIDYHVNEFYLLDGKKFSTSRRHAIWGKEILNPDTVDAVRLFLSTTRSEVQRTNFSMPDFTAFVEQDLIGGWQRWLNDLGSIVDTDFGGKAPDAGNWAADQQSFLADLESLRRDTGRALGAQGFSLNDAARHLADLASAAQRFAKVQLHLRGIAAESDKWRTAVALQLTAARLLAELSAPVAPRFSASLMTALGLPPLTAWPNSVTPIAAGATVALSGAAFFRPATEAAANLAAE